MARLVNDAGLLKEAVDAKSIKDVGLDVIFESIHKVQEEMGIAGTTAKEATSTFSGSLGMLSASWQNLLAAMTLGQGLDGAIAGLGESLAAFIPNALRLIGNLVTQIPALLSGIFTNLGPQLIPMAQELINGLAQGIMTAGPQMLTAAQGILSQLAAAITQNFPTLVQNGVGIVNGLVNGIVTGLPQIITTAGQMLTSLLQALLAALPTLWTAGVQIVVNLVSGLMQGLPQIITAAGQMIMTLMQTIMPMIPQLLTTGVEAMVQFVTGLVQGIMTGLPNVLAAIAQIIAQIVLVFVQNFPQIVTTGIQLLGKLITGIINAIPQLPGAIGQVIKNIKEAFSKFDWAKIGADILTGIKDGILGAVDAVVSAAKGAGEAIYEGIKGFFKIGSPSKLMADEVGRFIPPGIGVGIEQAMPALSRQISGALDGLVTNAMLTATAAPAAQPFGTPEEYAAAVAGAIGQPTLVIEGDMQGLFRQVRSYNTQRTRATGYNALAARS